MMTTQHTSNLPSPPRFTKTNHDWNDLMLPTLLLLDEIMTSSPNPISPKQHYHHISSSPKQSAFTDYHMSSPKQSTSLHHTISSPKPATSTRHISSPKSTHHHISSPKQSTSPHHTISSPKSTHHHIHSPKKVTHPYQTSQSQPSASILRINTQPTLPISQSKQSSPRSQPSSQPIQSSKPRQSSQPKQSLSPQLSSRSQQSTFNFLSNHNFATYMTPSCSISLTSFQPCALSEAVEAAVLQFPPLHEIMPQHTTQPNRTVHPSLLPMAVQSQSTPTRYRLHPTHRKTPSLPNLSQQQSSIEPLPISSMWESPQYENISS